MWSTRLAASEISLRYSGRYAPMTTSSDSEGLPMVEDECPESWRDNVVSIGVARDLEPWEVALEARLLVDIKTSRNGLVTRTLKPSAANVATILQHHPDWAGVIALNVFHLRIEALKVPPWHDLDMPSDPRPGAWTDADTARAAHWFARTSICGMKPIAVGAKVLEPAILVAAEARALHPVRDYLKGLSWDGDKRVDTWIANYLGGELTPYACATGAAFLIGLVARVMVPGCKLDTMIVIEGDQGRFKSTALDALTSPWFADSRLPIGDKDGMQMLAGVWLWEIGELAGLSKADVETVKAFLSSRTDRYRPSYGKRTIDVQRQIAFAGTTNATTYLQDETGGRRFNPIRTGTIDIPALRRDRDQLWAEAYQRFLGGERWWLPEGLAASEQAARFVVDEWQARIETYLRLRTSTTIGDILEDLIFRDVDSSGNARNTLSRWGQRDQNRVARCLRQIGWERRLTRGEGARNWMYYPPNYLQQKSLDGTGP